MTFKLAEAILMVSYPTSLVHRVQLAQLTGLLVFRTFAVSLVANGATMFISL